VLKGIYKRFDAHIIKVPNDSIELVFVMIVGRNNYKFILGACYISPSSKGNKYLALTETVEYIFNIYSPNKNFILIVILIYPVCGL
jgi:hypothetical protein